MPKKTNKTLYNRTNTCDNIKEDGKKCEERLIPKKVCKEYNKEGNWTGRWLCSKCYKRIDYKERYLCDRRTGNQDPNSNNAKGDLFQELTCRWRSTVSTIPVMDLNKKNDNYRSPIDHSIDSELGIIQTMGRLYNHIEKYWQFTGIEREWGKKFDHEICYCVSKDGKSIKRLYIFPKEEIIGRKGINIYKYILLGPHWYEKYRITDEETIKKVNEMWKEIISGK